MNLIGRKVVVTKSPYGGVHEGEIGKVTGKGHGNFWYVQMEEARMEGLFLPTEIKLLSNGIDRVLDEI